MAVGQRQQPYSGVEGCIQYDIYESGYRIMGDNLGGVKQRATD